MFENSSKIVIVMEYAGRGDLYDYVSERQRLSECDARHFFRQIVSAVQYCHQVGQPRLPCPVRRGGPWALVRFGPERFHDLPMQGTHTHTGRQSRGNTRFWTHNLGTLVSLALSPSLGGRKACDLCALYQ